MLLKLIVLAGLTFIINVIPAFMPPTWIFLVFFSLKYNLPVVLTIIIGIVFATLGRTALYYLSHRYFLKFLPVKYRLNINYLGQFLNVRRDLSIPLFVIFSFLPLPSNQLFIAAGIAEYNLKILISCFVVGRLISYSFFIGSSHLIEDNFGQIFSSNFSNIGMFVTQIIGFITFYILMKIGWKSIIHKIDPEFNL